MGPPNGDGGSSNGMGKFSSYASSASQYATMPVKGTQEKRAAHNIYQTTTLSTFAMGGGDRIFMQLL